MSLEKFSFKPFPFFQVLLGFWKLLSDSINIHTVRSWFPFFDSVLASDELDVDSDDCEELEDSELSVC